MDEVVGLRKSSFHWHSRIRGGVSIYLTGVT